MSCTLPFRAETFGLFDEHPFGFAMNFCKNIPQTEVWFIGYLLSEEHARK